MTKEQIEVVLDEIGGYSLDQIIDMKEVSYVYVTTDGNIYPDSASRFKFDSKHEVLIMYQGHTKTETSDAAGTLETFVNDYDYDIGAHYVDFGVIAGFVCVSKAHPKSSYNLGTAI